MLAEPDEIASKRKRTRDTLRVLQQAFRVTYPDFLICEFADSVGRLLKFCLCANVYLVTTYAGSFCAESLVITVNVLIQLAHYKRLEFKIMFTFDI